MSMKTNVVIDHNPTVNNVFANVFAFLNLYRELAAMFYTPFVRSFLTSTISRFERISSRKAIM